MATRVAVPGPRGSEGSLWQMRPRRKVPVLCCMWPVRFSTSPRVELTFLMSCGTVSGQNSLVTPHGHALAPQPPARCCVCPRMGPRALVQRPDLYPGAGVSVMRPAGHLVRSAGMRLGQRGEPGAGKRCVILRSCRAPPKGPKRAPVLHALLPGAAQLWPPSTPAWALQGAP